ncbi:hypothetical protein GGI15_002935 [Coemansia interrupta]|uniref:Uncharacterized protein n=1 Tax=Coemansia interrupta TaxID=1126814 RepID=A0A9W8LK42_9FUNG|nr:hypothetical protein GGI15_002935 [Coemansia interrupta]
MTAHMHSHTVVTPTELTRKGSSLRAHYDPYGSTPTSCTSASGAPSWRRLWQMLLTEHAFVGSPLYAGQLHLTIGLALYIVALSSTSPALGCLASLVVFDAVSLFADLAPRLLEYSGNNVRSMQRPFALALVPTLVQFANALTMLYRAVQALKEGVEYLAVQGNPRHHHHHGSSGESEFEAYVKSDLGLPSDAVTVDRVGVMLGVICVLGAMAITVYSAATHANHRGLWMLRSNTSHDVCTPLQNVLVNPYNRTTLFAGLCVLTLMALTSPGKHPMAEPLTCIAVALLMIFVALPTCSVLGRTLLLAAAPQDAAEMSTAVARVAMIPGVVRCVERHVWRAAQGTAVVVALRVEVDRSVDLRAQNTLRNQISSVLETSGLKSWSVDLRSAAAPSSDHSEKSQVL